MGQIDRISIEIAAIARRHPSAAAARPEIRQRVERFIADAIAFYKREPDAFERVRSDLATLEAALAEEAGKPHPELLAGAYGYACQVLSAKLHPRGNGA
jgi:hypothetical protein